MNKERLARLHNISHFISSLSMFPPNTPSRTLQIKLYTKVLHVNQHLLGAQLFKSE